MAARPLRRFLEVLGVLDRGAFAQACDTAMEKAITTLAELPSEKGKAVLTVTFTLQYEKGMVQVSADLKEKLPGYAPGHTAFWAAEGGLSTQHPSQIDMFPRDASDRRSGDA